MVGRYSGHNVQYQIMHDFTRCAVEARRRFVPQQELGLGERSCDGDARRMPPDNFS